MFVEAAVEFTVPLQKLSVIEGTPATFTCEVSNVKRDMPVTWLKDGKPLPTDDKNIEMQVVDKVFSLHIPSTVVEDEAEYTIVIGKSKSKAELLVDGELSYSGCHIYFQISIIGLANLLLFLMINILNI